MNALDTWKLLMYLTGIVRNYVLLHAAMVLHTTEIANSWLSVSWLCRMSQLAVVEFTASQTVEIVLTKWLWTEGYICYWPQFKSGKAAQLVKEQQTVIGSNILWEYLEVIQRQNVGNQEVTVLEITNLFRQCLCIPYLPRSIVSKQPSKKVNTGRPILHHSRNRPLQMHPYRQ